MFEFDNDRIRIYLINQCLKLMVWYKSYLISLIAIKNRKHAIFIITFHCICFPGLNELRLFEHEHNIELSKQRAESVRSWLITHQGIQESRLETGGLGATRPVASNNTAEGRN